MTTPRYESYQESKISAFNGAAPSPVGGGRRCDDRLENVPRPGPHLGARQDRVAPVEADDVLDLAARLVGLGARQVDLVDDRDDFQVVVHRQVGVGERLRLDALGGVHEQDGAFAGGERPRHLVGEIDVARRVDQVQDVPWDELVAADRKRSWTRWLVIALVVAGILAVATFVYQRWLAPSPQVVLAVSAVNDVEQLAMEQKWDEAFALTEQTLQQLPDNPDLLVWAGVLAERRGDTAAAADYLARAQQAIGDPMRYQVALSMRRLQASDLDGSEAAAQAALAIDPNEPQAVFFLANVAEMRNQPQQALELYQKTADLAEAGNPQLTVVAKMRYGMLLQQLNYSMGTPADEGAAPPPRRRPAHLRPRPRPDAALLVRPRPAARRPGPGDLYGAGAGPHVAAGGAFHHACHG